MTPKVSIIIPTYNREKFLTRALNSILIQTFKNFELIVIDDASTDNTEKVLKNFQKKDKRIKYFRNSQNKGPSESRNIGIRMAKGKYIAFLDSDDEWLPQKLEKQLKFIENKNAKVVTCWAYVNDKIRKKKYFYKVPYYKNPISKILKKNYILSGPSSVILERKVIDKVGFFDSLIRYGEDWDYWIRIIKAGYNFFVVKEPLLKYYLWEGSATITVNFSKKAKDLNRILEKHKELFLKYPKIYARRLRTVGYFFALDGNIFLARKFFLKSFKSGNYKSLIDVLLSLLGPGFYRKFIRGVDFIKESLKNLLEI